MKLFYLIVFGKVGSYRRQFVHNAIVHPLMMFMPASWANTMHDKNFDWAFTKIDAPKSEKNPNIDWD